MGDGHTSVLLIDLDGTIISSDEAQRLCWTRWANRHGLDATAFLAAHGQTAKDKIKALAPWLDAESEAEAVTDLEVCERTGLAALPGARELWASGRRFAIVTSAHRRLAVARLRAVGLPPERAAVLVTAEDVVRGKPDRAPYLLAARLMGSPPWKCTVIEDAPLGVEAGVAAGMRVVALTTTVGAAELGEAHMIVANIAEYLRREEAGAGEP